jgi:hypothetical protein
LAWTEYPSGPDVHEHSIARWEAFDPVEQQYGRLLPLEAQLEQGPHFEVGVHVFDHHQLAGFPGQS